MVQSLIPPQKGLASVFAIYFCIINLFGGGGPILVGWLLEPLTSGATASEPSDDNAPPVPTTAGEALIIGGTIIAAYVVSAGLMFFAAVTFKDEVAVRDAEHRDGDTWVSSFREISTGRKAAFGTYIVLLIVWCLFFIVSSLAA